MTVLQGSLKQVVDILEREWCEGRWLYRSLLECCAWSMDRAIVSSHAWTMVRAIVSYFVDVSLPTSSPEKRHPIRLSLNGHPIQPTLLYPTCFGGSLLEPSPMAVSCTPLSYNPPCTVPPNPHPCCLQPSSCDSQPLCAGCSGALVKQMGSAAMKRRGRRCLCHATHAMIPCHDVML